MVISIKHCVYHISTLQETFFKTILPFHRKITLLIQTISTQHEMSNIPPPIVEILPISRLIRDQTVWDFPTFGLNHALVGPEHELTLIIRIHPVSKANNFGKDNGFVVSKNASILLIRRAVQDDNLCLRVVIRCKNKFRIRFFDPQMKVLGEYIIDVDVCPDLSFENVFEQIDNQLSNSDRSVPSEPLAILSILDALKVFSGKGNIKFDMNWWKTEITMHKTLKSLWTVVKSKIGELKEIPPPSHKKLKIKH